MNRLLMIKIAAQKVQESNKLSNQVLSVDREIKIDYCKKPSESKYTKLDFNQ